MEGRSLDISHENLHKLHTLFPNILSDGKNRYKTLKPARCKTRLCEIFFSKAKSETRRIYEIFEDWTMKFRKKDEAEMGFATG